MLLWSLASLSLQPSLVSILVIRTRAWLACSHVLTVEIRDTEFASFHTISALTLRLAQSLTHSLLLNGCRGSQRLDCIRFVCNGGGQQRIRTRQLVHSLTHLIRSSLNSFTHSVTSSCSIAVELDWEICLHRRQDRSRIHSTTSSCSIAVDVLDDSTAKW